MTNFIFQYLRQNQDIIRDRILDEEFVLKIFEEWYSNQLFQIHEWLKIRAGNSLHLHQLKSLIRIFKKMYKDFELQGILNCRQDPWKSIQQRLTVSTAL